MSKGLLILDRDGTLNKRIPGSYLLLENQISLAPDISLISNLNDIGWEIVIATNQACISKGLISTKQVVYLTQLILQPWLQLKESDIYICPHEDYDGCMCRKPKPGMLEEILLERPYPRNQVLFVGDSVTDFQAAKASGIEFAGVCWDSVCQGIVCKHSIGNVVEHLSAGGYKNERAF